MQGRGPAEVTNVTYLTTLTLYVLLSSYNSLFDNNLINAVYISGLVIGPITFLKSFSAGEYTAWAAMRSEGFFKHNINLYPRSYPFIPLGEEKQLEYKASCSRTNVSQPGFEPSPRQQMLHFKWEGYCFLEQCGFRFSRSVYSAVLFTSKVNSVPSQHQARVFISRFLGILNDWKYFYSPLGQDASPSQVTTPQLLPVPICTSGWREAFMIKCLGVATADQARIRTHIQSITEHESTAVDRSATTPNCYRHSLGWRLSWICHKRVRYHPDAINHEPPSVLGLIKRQDDSLPSCDKSRRVFN